MADTKKEKKEPKVIKCYHCHGVIERHNDLVEKQIPMATKKGGKRNYRRKFHLQCLHDFLERSDDFELNKKEDSDWDAVYRYFRKEILNQSESIKLNEHTVKRLRGLRIGQYYPSGNNTKILKRGFEYETILIALKVLKAKIHSLIGTQNFKDNKHRIDWIMKIVTNEIDDVQRRVDMKKRSEGQLQSRLDNDDVYKEKTVSTPEYKPRGGRKRRGTMLGGND